MKKNILLLSFILLLSGCVSFNSKVDVFTFQPKKLDTIINLGDMVIEPVHSISGIEDILPDIIKSVALENGIEIRYSDSTVPLTMDIYLYRKFYLKGFQKYESVTLMMKIFSDEGEIANALYTRDSQIPLDSFAQVYEIFQTLIPELRKEYDDIQKQLEKGELL